MRYAIPTTTKSSAAIFVLLVTFIYNEQIFFIFEFKMTVAILIQEKLGDIKEINLDISPSKNEIFKILCGSPTFIGQWPELDVVIIKREVEGETNLNLLPYPFDNEIVESPILLVRMDENSDPRDFTLEEYLRFVRRNKRIAT
jgi:hypothetical protein